MKTKVKVMKTHKCRFMTLQKEGKISEEHKGKG